MCFYRNLLPAQRARVPEALGALGTEGAHVTGGVIEREAVVDDVIGTHAKAVVHQGSHAVIPGKAEGGELSGPLRRQKGRFLSPVTPALPPAPVPYLLCTTMAALGSPVVPDV